MEEAGRNAQVAVYTVSTRGSNTRWPFRPELSRPGVSNSFWFAGRVRPGLVSGGLDQWDQSIITNGKYRPIM